jgi:hypothetical protein
MQYLQTVILLIHSYLRSDCQKVARDLQAIFTATSVPSPPGKIVLMTR